MVILPVFISPLLTVAVLKSLGQYRGNESQRQLHTDRPTPGIQYIPPDPGPHMLGQYVPVIPVRVVTPTPLPSFCI